MEKIKRHKFLLEKSEEKLPPGKLGVDVRTTLRRILKIRMRGCGLDSSGSQ
jgi:hypothetical protein